MSLLTEAFVRFDWDHRKSESNLDKHGSGFEHAVRLWEDRDLAWRHGAHHLRQAVIKTWLAERIDQETERGRSLTTA